MPVKAQDFFASIEWQKYKWGNQSKKNINLTHLSQQWKNIGLAQLIEGFSTILSGVGKLVENGGMAKYSNVY